MLIKKIIAYPDVMKHKTDVKANMTDWRMHMKDDDFGKLASTVETIAKNMRYGSTHVDGDTYEGQWANDKANGFGIYNHVNGAKYQGFWKDDLQHGIGVETWVDTSKYEGEYSFGRKHGLGAY